MSRPNWDEYFMHIARTVATRATCDRKHVGAVIVRNKTILSTGYNGAPRGLPECDGVGHDMKEMGGRQSCVRTVHAEANAIAQAARSGVAIEDAELFSTASLCLDCAKLAINAGIRRVCYAEEYSSRYGASNTVPDLLKAAGIELVHVPIPELNVTPMKDGEVLR
jgi:dCMP deaminase